MSETKIFCSVIVFTLGVYTIILLQYELFKLNSLAVRNKSHGHVKTNSSNGNGHALCNATVPRMNMNLDRINCGSAGEILNILIHNCTELPCDIVPDASYIVALNFKPSRNVSDVEIETFVRKKKELKYRHKQSVFVNALEGLNTTLKFSFSFPSHHATKSMKSFSKCPAHNLYMVGVEIWDMASGIGEVCLAIPTIVSYS